MPEEKTYKYISVCERAKPFQTNNKSMFISHVSWCPTCRSKLPKSIIEELEPRLSQLVAERAKSAEAAGEKGAPAGEKEAAKVPKREQKTTAPSIAEEQKVRLDALVKDLPSFQDLRKSVASISGQISSIGEMLGQKIEEGKVELGTEETGKQPSPETSPQGTGKQPGEFGSGQRQGAFGQSEELPAANRPGYQPGQQTPSGTPPAKKPPSDEVKEPPPKEKKGTGLPDLDTPEQIENMEKYLEDQKKRQKTKQVGAKPGITEETVRESADKWLGVVEKAVDIIKGKSPAAEGEAPKGQAGQLIEGMKVVADIYGTARKITVEEQNTQQKNFNDMYKNMLDTIKLGLGMGSPKAKPSPQATGGGSESSEEKPPGTESHVS